MSSGFSRKIEFVANLAIIAIALLLALVLIKTYFVPRALTDSRTDLASIAIRPGSKINLTGEDWAKNGRTLLLGLSTTCHFCSDSAPFYQRLVQKNPKIRLVAVLPQTIDEGRKYLLGLGVSIDDVKQVSFDSIGITGTPTLILVNDTGTVTDVWQGKLMADEELKVLNRL